MLSIKNSHLEPKINYPVHLRKRLLKEFAEADKIKGGDMLIDWGHVTNTESPLLYLCKLNSEIDILLCVYIPDEYPYIQPGIRIIKPILDEYLSPHVIGGSICADILHGIGWSPTNTILSTITTLLPLITNSKIDKNMIGEEYNIDRYKKSYLSIKRGHGW